MEFNKSFLSKVRLLIEFRQKELSANFSDSKGAKITRIQQIRTDPVTLKTCRITPGRALEEKRDQKEFHRLPQKDLDPDQCPFCPGNIDLMTPCLAREITDTGKLYYRESVLFPNLYPYTEWSAVSLFGKDHYVEIGTASAESYADSFINCARYLSRVKSADPGAVYMSITQNHLPGAGGSLVHPHLQVHASKTASNAHNMLRKRYLAYLSRHRTDILADLTDTEKKTGQRYIGSTGMWEWMAAFAPSGFHEIWGIAPTRFSLMDHDDTDLWTDLARGILNIQKLYRNLGKNAYNLAMISLEGTDKAPCLRACITARSNYAPWVRNDFTGFEIASKEMATFTFPEDLALTAKKFW